MDGSKFIFKAEKDSKIAGKNIFGTSRLQRKDNIAAPAGATEGFKPGFSFTRRQPENSAESKPQETSSSSGFTDRFKISNVATSRDAAPSLFRQSVFDRTGNTAGNVILPRDSMKWIKPKDERARSNSPSSSPRHHSERERDNVSRLGGFGKREREIVSHAAPPSMNADQKSAVHDLVSLRGKQCPTEYDKYMVLEERDKLLYKIRSGSEKPGGVPFKPNAGFCTSMCTEKEQYVRETQKRISPLECSDDGEVDCSKLVKEYARSAADQEKPLPHELRCVKTLQNSMVYLLTKILDQMPSSSDELAGWYDFLWSRTRAIRKEITQLMLTDEIAIALVERCTRLHILCSYALCGLEVKLFDQNMNTENLAKCLQTLRHLYDDLEHRGIHCSSEAEFRAYDVMLHLHDSNVLRQVLSYRKDVRESRSVRLAIQLACCLQSNNYVRFFRLLKNDASFLQACICHRFFNLVRSNALSTLVNSSGRNSPYLLSKLARTLAFDNSTSAMETLNIFGIFPDEGSDDMVILGKDTFTADIATSWNTFQWVDMKTDKRRSQIVYGCDILPQLTPSVIRSSFDENDVYRCDPVLEAYLTGFGSQSRSVPPSVITATIPSFIPPSIPRPTLPAAEPPKFDSMKNALTQRLCDQILSEVTDSAFRSATLKGAMSAQKIVAEEREILRRKQKEDIRQFVERLTLTMVNNAVENMLQRSFNIERRACFNNFVDERASAVGNYVWVKVALPYCDERLRSIVRKSVKSEKEMFDKQLVTVRKRMHLLWLKQFWDVWRTKVIAIRKRKERRSAQWSEFNFTENSSFKPQAYMISGRNSTGLNVDASFIPTELRLMQWRMKRRMRIARNAFQKWRDMVHQRLSNRRLLEAMSSSFCSNSLKDMTLRYGQKRRYVTDAKQIPQKYLRRSLDEQPSFSFAAPNLTNIHHQVTPTHLNSTAMTWHSNVKPGFCHSMSAIDFSPRITSPEPVEKDLNTSMRDIDYVRRVCGQLDSFSIPTISQRSAQKYSSGDYTLHNQTKTYIPKQIVKGIESTHNATENLEAGVLDLEKRMMNHSSLLADLINKFQTKTVQRN